jgi:hypothetical protein
MQLFHLLFYSFYGFFFIPRGVAWKSGAFLFAGSANKK